MSNRSGNGNGGGNDVLGADSEDPVPGYTPPFEPMVDEYLDCCGKKRRFKVQTRLTPGGEFLYGEEERDDDNPGLRFVMRVPADDLPPLGELRDKIRERLSSRDVARNPDTGRIQMLTRHVRAQITTPSDGYNSGAGPGLVLNDDVITWEELGQELQTFEGWGVRIEIRETGNE